MRADIKTSSRIRGTTPEIEAIARIMRENMAPAEQRLWEAINRKQLGGRRFRAQHPVGQFIADFYCPRYKLVVEVDGQIHDEVYRARCGANTTIPSIRISCDTLHK